MSALESEVIGVYQKEIEELRAEKKKLFGRIVAANKILQKMPSNPQIWCGSCGQKLRPIPWSARQKEWFEQLRQALLFPAAEEKQTET